MVPLQEVEADGFDEGALPHPGGTGHAHPDGAPRLGDDGFEDLLAEGGAVAPGALQQRDGLGDRPPVARAHLAAGRLELRGLLDAVYTSYFEPDDLAGVDPSGRALTNLSTPEDVARAEALLSGG